VARSNFVPNPAKIKVIGLGGGGCNAVSRMVKEKIQGVEFIAVNTDAQALLLTEAPTRIQIGEKLTKGLGVGGDPELGAKAAEESRGELKQIIEGADMVFITAGMGGGTGTGASSIIAETVKESGALTIAIVTKPFKFEGAPRRRVSEEGIAKMVSKVDTLIIIPNDRLLTLCDHKVLMQDAFKMADDVLQQGVRAISEVITVPGMINLDFADVKAVMKDAGPAWMSIGYGSGQDRAVEAAQQAIASPLLDVSVKGAKGVLFNITGGNNLTLHEADEAAQVIQEAVDPEANIIFGVVFDPKMEEEVSITLIATGFVSKVGAGPKEDELLEMLKGIKGDEAELDIPSFLRHPITLRRRQAMAPQIKVTRPSTPSRVR
jgi:cell division protein FtsZ